MCALRYAGYTNAGRRRSSNDDRWAADPAQCLYIVADGVGSASRGGFGAQLATELLPGYLAHHLSDYGLGSINELCDPDAAPLLGKAVAQLSDDMHARSQSEPGLAETETTVVAAVVTTACALIAHLGDSRAYLHRDQQVHRLTRDHSFSQALLDANEITPAEAADHPMRSTITRHIGMTPPAAPDVRGVRLAPGDRVLLCTDGLNNAVDDTSLAEILATHPDPADACATLIAAANQAGGADNITALLVDIPANTPSVT